MFHKHYIYTFTYQNLIRAKDCQLDQKDPVNVPKQTKQELFIHHLHALWRRNQNCLKINCYHVVM